VQRFWNEVNDVDNDNSGILARYVAPGHSCLATSTATISIDADLFA